MIRKWLVFRVELDLDHIEPNLAWVSISQMLIHQHVISVNTINISGTLSSTALDNHHSTFDIDETDVKNRSDSPFGPATPFQPGATIADHPQSFMEN